MPLLMLQGIFWYVVQRRTKTNMSISLLFLLALAIISVSSQETCKISPKVSSILHWSEQVTKHQDAKRLKKNWSSVNFPNPKTNLDGLRDLFFRATTESLQNSCRFLKRLGGTWLGGCGYLDGEKLICMDGLYMDILQGKCLVYSFGIGMFCPGHALTD